MDRDCFNKKDIDEYINFIKRYKTLKTKYDKYKEKIINKLDVLYAFTELSIISFFIFCMVFIGNTFIKPIDRLMIGTALILVIIFIIIEIIESLNKHEKMIYRGHERILKRTGNLYFKLLFYKKIKKNKKHYKELVKELEREENEKILFLVKDSDLNHYLKRECCCSKIDEMEDVDLFKSFYDENILKVHLKKYEKPECNGDKKLTNEESFVLSNLENKNKIEIE